MTYPTTIKAIIDGSQLYQGEPLYMSDIDTYEAALAGAVSALGDYLEQHFADQIYCGHGRTSEELAAKLAEDVDCELADEGRYNDLAAQDTGWRSVASLIVLRTSITLSLLHQGKTDVYSLHYCGDCASGRASGNAWSAGAVKL